MKNNKEKNEIIKVEKPISQPVRYTGRLKNGWTLSMIERWREIRRMFGK